MDIKRYLSRDSFGAAFLARRFFNFLELGVCGQIFAADLLSHQGLGRLERQARTAGHVVGGL